MRLRSAPPEFVEVGGLSARIHLVADARGRPMCFSLTGGQRANVSRAIPFQSGIDTGAVIADKGYESNRLLTFIREPAPRWSSHTGRTTGTLGNTTGTGT